MDEIARTPKQIGQALRRRRRALRLSQSDLAVKAGLRQATISAVESGEERTQLRSLCALMAALGLELAIRPRTRAAMADTIEDMF